MTDSEKFTMVQKTKRDIQKLGFAIEIFHGRSIHINSDNFYAIWEANGLFKVFNNKPSESMNNEQWENYSAEVDNLNRAIFWVNTQLKNIVFSL